MTGVVLEGGVLGACPGLGLSQDEEGGAARCHVQGLRQEALPEVPAPDVEPQVPYGVHVLRGALNSGTARGWGAPAPGPALRERVRPGGRRVWPSCQAASWAARRSRPMRPNTVVREGVPAGRSPVSLGSTQSRRAGACAPRTLKPTGLAGWRARA